MGLKTATKPTTWHAFFTVGLLFPLHIIIGVLTWPLLIIAMLCGSTWALGFTLM